MAAPALIYCGGGNPRFYEIATRYGFEYGARLPDTVYGPLYFADQNYHNPDREAYMRALAMHHPVMATVLDLERAEQLPEVLDWATEAAQYVQRVMIIPKVWGVIERLPRQINSAQVILGYSVPTKYGGTAVPTVEFQGWPVHLLGGSPHRQIELFHYFDNVVSLDGNMTNLMATRHCQFWVPGTARYAKNRYWPTLKEANGGELWESENPDADAPYEAFQRSCENIMRWWNEN